MKLARHSRMSEPRLSPANGHARRRGATLLELVVGAVLIGVFVTGAVPVIRWVHLASRLNEQHRIATQEIANQMEHLAALPASGITAEHLESLTPSAASQSSLPDADLKAVTEPSGDGLQKVTLNLTWTSASSAQSYPVRLTAWLPSPTD